ncbi:hypothetical protein EAI_11619, partial [Harpegnathos saltator]
NLIILLNSFESLPEFICFSKTWLSDSDIFNIPNFQIVTHNRNSIEGGSAIACRNDIKFSFFKDDALERLCYKYNINCCSIRFSVNNSQLVLVSFYNPPNNNLFDSSCNKNGWEEILTCFDNCDKVIITGDFNYKHPL